VRDSQISKALGGARSAPERAFQPRAPFPRQKPRRGTLDEEIIEMPGVAFMDHFLHAGGCLKPPEAT
jgi:hypothetical protein